MNRGNNLSINGAKTSFSNVDNIKAVETTEATDEMEEINAAHDSDMDFDSDDDESDIDLDDEDSDTELLIRGDFDENDDNDLAEEDGEAGIEDEDYSKLTVPTLKDLLRSKGLKVSGTKAELIERLLEDEI
jgi:hypothetical protein